MKGLGLSVVFGLSPETAFCKSSQKNRPNIILMMSDDQGWGDTGYNGHPVLETPYLDQMSQEGIRLDRFYSGAPVCSPTRGSCLTGRHPYRYGIYGANSGHLKKEEVTLAEVLKPMGYATGHFGKWHLGTLTKDVKDGRRGGRAKRHYSPPWKNGFDECFSTECQMPTWNPMENQSVPSRYWKGPDQYAHENLNGDDSRVIMDRAIPFIQKSVKQGKHFFAVIWFHTPHSPVIAGPKYLAMYPDQDENHQHYYGCITAMDEQIGRLRRELKNLRVDNNTMLWFCSDNGPAAKGGGPGKTPGGRQQGASGPFRGRKGSLYEGGVRVPGLLVWPDKISKAVTSDFPCCTSDYFPTVLNVMGDSPANVSKQPVDGISLLPMMEGKMTKRPVPIAFEHRRQLALIDNRYKLYSNNKGKIFELYDLIDDPEEKKNIAPQNKNIVQKMKEWLEDWRKSCRSGNQTNYTNHK